MGFLDFFTGGNAKVVAKFIVNLHMRAHGDYQAVYDAISVSMLEELHNSGVKKTMTVHSFLPKVENYTDLGVLYLYFSASPRDAD